MPRQKSIDDIISSLSIDQKLSQLFVAGYYGLEIPAQLLSWIDNHLGGVIYFKENIAGVDDIARKNMSLQAVSPLGLFIAVDQEGGQVERISGASQIPSAMALSATNNMDYITIANELLARELHLAGFNLNFTPVLDVNTCRDNPVIGIRSFGESTEVVSNCGLKVIEAMRKHQVIPVAKHFPGHGPVNLDSHLNLPVCNLSAEELMETHLPPFCRAIDNNIEMIMISHVAYTAYNGVENIPASLSYEVIELLLRNKLAYQGLIITDDLNMKAISSGITIEEAAVRALQAGVDILLYRNFEDAILAYKQILFEIEMGNISEDIINKSLKKILTLKHRYKIKNACYHYQKEQIEKEINKVDLQNIFDQSITVFKKSEIDFSRKTIVLSVDKNNLVHYKNEPEWLLSSLLNGVQEYKIPLKPSKEDIQRVLNVIKPFDNIIFISYNACFNLEQEDLIRIIPDKHSLYLLAAGSPFDILLAPEAKLLAMTYGYGNSSLKAFARFLLSEIDSHKHSPIDLLLKT